MLSLLKALIRSQPSTEEKPPKGGIILHDNNTSCNVEDINRNINVKPIHSHDDCLQIVPLVSALRQGSQSVEVDVWCLPFSYTQRTEYFRVSQNLFYKGNWPNVYESMTPKDDIIKKVISKKLDIDQIYVHCDRVFLEPEDTLEGLYLDRIYYILKSSNSEYKYTEASKQDQNSFESEFKYGLFYNSPETPFYLWLNFKADAHQTYHALQKYLQRFIDEDYLAYYDVATQTFHPGPVIITITGNIPWDLIEAEQKRYVFADAPLKDFAAQIDDDTGIASKLEKYSKLCIFASASLQDLLLGGEKEFKSVSRKASFGDEINQRLKSIFDLAHTYGLKTLVRGDIAFPSKFVRGHLTDLYEAGTDLLNVEDLDIFDHDA